MAKKGGQKKNRRLRRQNFKALPLFGVLPLLIQKKIEVCALIRSVAFIRVLLLFGGVTPPRVHGSSPPPGTFWLFGVLWYTFLGSKKVFAMAKPA